MISLDKNRLELSVVVLAYRSEDYLELFCKQLIRELNLLDISYENNNCSQL
jgi:hypothetical protein